MKKYLFLAVAATAMMASCSNDEVVEMAQGRAIAFDTFVNKQTRAELNTDNLTEFKVWGYQDGVGYIFDEERVAKNITNTDLSQAWKYEDTRYWVKGANYFFEAIAPITNGHWIITKSNAAKSSQFRFDNTSTTGANGEVDLIYATATANPTDLANVAPVSLTFKHLLSRVKFTFTNGMKSDDVTLRIYDITIKGTWGAALINKSATSTVWGSNDGSTVDLECSEITSISNASDASSGVKYMIPQEETAVAYAISFKVDLLQNGIKTATYTHSVVPGSTNPLTLPAVKMQEGYSYNFTATITPENITGDADEDLKPIEFTATVTNWTETEGGEIVL